MPRRRGPNLTPTPLELPFGARVPQFREPHCDQLRPPGALQVLRVLNTSLALCALARASRRPQAEALPSGVSHLVRAHRRVCRCPGAGFACIWGLITAFEEGKFDKSWYAQSGYCEFDTLRVPDAGQVQQDYLADPSNETLHLAYREQIGTDMTYSCVTPADRHVASASRPPSHLLCGCGACGMRPRSYEC